MGENCVESRMFENNSEEASSSDDADYSSVSSETSYELVEGKSGAWHRQKRRPVPEASSPAFSASVPPSSPGGSPFQAPSRRLVLLPRRSLKTSGPDAASSEEELELDDEAKDWHTFGTVCLLA
jgi:hypothetical protein